VETSQTSPAVDAATEVKAMSKMVEALEGLDTDARHRVLEWASKRYGVSPTRDRTQRGTKTEETAGGDDTNVDDDYADLAALYSAAGPTTDAEKVLVAGYWHQVKEKKENLDSQALNTDLKDLGHQVGNVTRACSVLMKAKPQLMIQVKKTGSTKQARKQYRLTSAGLQRLREMLTKGDEDEGEA
jgi:hypothetical protein